MQKLSTIVSSAALQVAALLPAMHECLDKVVASLFQLRPLHDRDQRVEGKLRLVEALVSELQKFDGFGSGRRSLIHLLLTGKLPCASLHSCFPRQRLCLVSALGIQYGFSRCCVLGTYSEAIEPW